ncbi:phage tail assembly chaperone [Parasphingorhabdus flavimaris]|uniref:phage tail assembly chaperone n=1 Tax=Parasphingorhabdus flavimaris TaxID=266812 RepID=UPI003001D486
MREPCPGEGRGPSPVIASAGPSGDGLPPSRENRIFAVSASTLSGTVSAVLGWTPEQFWEATPAELAAIFSVFADNHSGQRPLGTTQLEKLKEVFPDG